jgi:hypothetical protein
MSTYKWLLHLYPATFYRQFGDQMSLDFDDGYAAARRRGRWTTGSFLARCYGDLAASLLMQWLRNESLVIGAMSAATAVSVWAAAFYIAAHEWPNGPVTSWFIWQVGVALAAGSVLTQRLLRINR